MAQAIIPIATSLSGIDLVPVLERMHSTAEQEMRTEMADWDQKTEVEREALIWVRMAETASNMEDYVSELQGAILAHIQAENLLAHHPGRANWDTFEEFIQDRMNNATAPSTRSDLAFLSAQVIPVAHSLGGPVPTLSALRALVPRLRRALREDNQEEFHQIIVNAGHMTQQEVLALEPNYRAEARVRIDNDLRHVSVDVNPRDLNIMRRALPWMNFVFE